MDITDTASGKAFFKRPGMMRWEYEEPDRQVIVLIHQNGLVAFTKRISPFDDFPVTDLKKMKSDDLRFLYKKKINPAPGTQGLVQQSHETDANSF